MEHRDQEAETLACPPTAPHEHQSVPDQVIFGTDAFHEKRRNAAKSQWAPLTHPAPRGVPLDFLPVMARQPGHVLALLFPELVASDKKGFVQKNGDKSKMIKSKGRLSALMNFSQKYLRKNGAYIKLPRRAQVGDPEVFRAAASATTAGKFIACMSFDEHHDQHIVAIIDGFAYDPSTQTDGLIYPVPVANMAEVLGVASLQKVAVFK